MDQRPLIDATTNADFQDYEDALKTGEIKPTEPAKAEQQHSAVRSVLSLIAIDQLHGHPVSTWPPPSPTPNPSPTPTPSLPDEEDSEFADYDQGAFAFHLGKSHWNEAEQSWEKLLKRPAEQRHFRSVWATFMLGKLAMKRLDPDAVKWFEQTRQLVREGFADSLGMAADSYGWEGRSEMLLGHLHHSAELYLNQLALGDESAVPSLEAVLFSAEKSQEASPASGELHLLAADPLLRRLKTARLLAQGDTDVQTNNPFVIWLKAVEKENLTGVEDAEYLGWIAYSGGDYRSAEHWLKLSSGTSSIARWLDAKLQLRAGKLDLAAKDLDQVIASVNRFYAWSPGAYKDSNCGYVLNLECDDGWPQDKWACGDLGAVHLARGDFVQALDVFLKGNMWTDAAFLAESVLTSDELKRYVDHLPLPQFPPTPIEIAQPNGPDHLLDIRYLLGRKLVREGRFSEAISYLPFPHDRICKKYVECLKMGSDTSLPRKMRAQALFTAAWICRTDGMEIMGTEVAPDWFYYNGDYSSYSLADERLAGCYTIESWDAKGKAYQQKVKNPLPPSAREIRRLTMNAPEPDKRYHYRWIASELAIKAAGLLETNTEELADVVNTAGTWIKDHDEKRGDAIYQLIDQRCYNTDIGKQDMAVHWFVAPPGPMSVQAAAEMDVLTQGSANDPSTPSSP